ncbi:amidohydrolase [Streptomyces shenzhenensis]|uniref:amidohydrolase n=1 Tax=Streptomyces shenzhenensis TaxID=943815 RepID=UPI0036A191DC
MTALPATPAPAPSGAGARTKIFTGPRILAGDGTEPEALAVRSGWIVAAGTRHDLRSAFPEAEEVALDGALVVPGFNDAHCHPSQAALARVRVDLNTLPDAGAVLSALRRQARRTPPGQWVVGQPLDERRIGVLDRDMLDQVSDSHPVLVIHYSLHRAVANSAGLAALGYRSPADAPPGGQLGVHADGRLDGHLVERAWLDPWLPGTGAASIAPYGTPSAQQAALKDVIAELHACGITSFCDALVTPAEQELYARTLAAGELTARVGMLLWHSYADPERLPGDGPDPLRLRTVGVKMMLDGALSGGTCLCRSPYPSATGTGNGLQILGDDEFTATVRAIDAAGGRVAVHANGDQAVQTVLDVIESLPGSGTRHRIEHCSLIDDSLAGRIARAQLITVPFGPFVALHGEKLLDYYGDRVDHVCAHRTLRDAGIVVAGSSDYPLAPPDPLLAIRSLVTRTTAAGTTVGAGQRIGAQDAVDVYTRGSAAASDDESVKGTLTVGRLADLAVLDTDLTTAEPDALPEIRIRSTWVGGECVYTSHH